MHLLSSLGQSGCHTNLTGRRLGTHAWKVANRSIFPLCRYFSGPLSFIHKRLTPRYPICAMLTSGLNKSGNSPLFRLFQGV